MSKKITEKILESIGNIKQGRLTIILPSGKELHLGGNAPGHHATLTVTDNRFFRW